MLIGTGTAGTSAIGECLISQPGGTGQWPRPRSADAASAVVGRLRDLASLSAIASRRRIRPAMASFVRGWHVELPQFLQAGVLVLQTELSCLEQMLRDVVTQYFQGTTNAQ